MTLKMWATTAKTGWGMASMKWPPSWKGASASSCTNMMTVFRTIKQPMKRSKAECSTISRRRLRMEPVGRGCSGPWISTCTNRLRLAGRPMFWLNHLLTLEVPTASSFSGSCDGLVFSCDSPGLRSSDVRCWPGAARAGPPVSPLAARSGNASASGALAATACVTSGPLGSWAEDWPPGGSAAGGTRVGSATQHTRSRALRRATCCRRSIASQASWCSSRTCWICAASSSLKEYCTSRAASATMMLLGLPSAVTRSRTSSRPCIPAAFVAARLGGKHKPEQVGAG
mmetsp:Transcript_61554/g.190665  ORF Transcript_61554/g.190665 Transcript_61554/m.190665 type:complete len:285 (+) Transcript_61554:944-1798(+)